MNSDNMGELIPASADYANHGTTFFYYGLNETNNQPNWRICWVGLHFLRFAWSLCSFVCVSLTMTHLLLTASLNHTCARESFLHQFKITTAELSPSSRNADLLNSTLTPSTLSSAPMYLAWPTLIYLHPRLVAMVATAAIKASKAITGASCLLGLHLQLGLLSQLATQHSHQRHLLPHHTTV